MNNILEIKELSKSYDDKKMALSDCTFSLESGKICAIVGESGGGKSTLLRLIAGLERPSQGVIKIQDELVSDDRIFVAPQERHIGFVFQDLALFPHLTVAQNITFGLKKNKKEAVQRWLKLIKMEDYAAAYPNMLSGGQQQRVALVRTLALEPKLLLLDEPFSSLDTGLKRALRQEIRQLVKDLKTSMIFITHDIYDAIDIADEIIFLKDGILLQHSSIKNLSQNIQNPIVGQMILELKSNAERILKHV